MTTRRPHPPFLPVTVLGVQWRTPRMVRVTFAGPALAGLAQPDPAASVRLLLPSPGSSSLVIPTWTGNEFLLDDGQRPLLRTFTPRRLERHPPALDVDIVVHPGGGAAAWASGAGPGDPAAISGPARGYAVDAEATGFLLAGDESAVPAISQLLEVLPQVPVEVHIEVSQPDARPGLPLHPHATVAWHVLPPGAPPGDALVAAVSGASSLVGTGGDTGTKVWVAGEAASVQRIRRHLFEARDMPRSQATIRGYWKHGRAGDAAADDPGDQIKGQG